MLSILKILSFDILDYNDTTLKLREEGTYKILRTFQK